MTKYQIIELWRAGTFGDKEGCQFFVFWVFFFFGYKGS